MTAPAHLALARFRRQRWAFAGLALLALVAASLLRQAGVESWRTLFAEDGVIFLRGAIVDGAGAFTTTYAGYLHTLPRIVAVPEGVLPVSWAAGYSAVAAAVVGGACALVQFHATRTLVRSATLRALLASSLVLAPVMALEVDNTVAYAFWPLTVACFWVLLIPPRSTVDTVAASAVAFLAIASQPLNLVFAPLAVAGAIRTRSRSSIVVLGAYGAGALVQIAGVLSAPSGGWHFGTLELESLARGYGLRVVAALWLGEPWLKDSWLALGSTLIVIATVFTLVVVVWLLVLNDRVGRRAASKIWMFSGLFAFVTVIARGPVIGTGTDVQWKANGTRYIVVPLLLALGAVLVLIDHAVVSPRVRRGLHAAATAWMVILIVAGFRVANYRSDGPQWAPTVSAAGRACKGRGMPRELALPITPKGFLAALPCRVLR